MPTQNIKNCNVAARRGQIVFHLEGFFLNMYIVRCFVILYSDAEFTTCFTMIILSFAAGRK